MTLFEYISQHHSSSLAYVDPETGKEFSWDEIAFQPLGISSSFRKLCFLYLDNSVASISTFFSLLGTPHCICLLSSDIKNELKESLESNYQPEVIIDNKRRDITGYSVREQQLLNTYPITIFEADGRRVTLHPELKILLPTSGTTGSPKFVKLTDENFIANTISILGYLPVAENDSTPLNLPINYSYGLSVLLTNSVRGGKIVCTNESILSRKFWDQFVQFKCTNFAGVPYTYEMLQRIAFTKMENLQLKYFTQAGGKLDVKYRKLYSEYAQKKNVQFYVMYGQTEATARMAYLNPKYSFNKMESIGQPIPEGNFSIDDQTSELIYEGKNVFRGYAYSAADLQTLENIPALHTGDLARRDKEGFYYITGRINRFVKLFGNRVGLDEAEVLLRKHFEGSIACTGVNDQFLVVFSDQPDTDEASVKNILSKTYNLHISAIRFKFVLQFPLNVNHKVDYQKLLAEYGQ